MPLHAKYSDYKSMAMGMKTTEIEMAMEMAAIDGNGGGCEGMT